MQLKKPPSFQKQTSRYEDRLRNEDLAVQAAFEKRKESKKLSQQEDKKIKSKTAQLIIKPSQEEAFDFFTKTNWNLEKVRLGRRTSQKVPKGPKRSQKVP